MWNKLADWIAGIIRKELAELAAVLGKDTEEAAKRAESDLAAIKAHVAQELTKAKQELIGFNSTAFVNLRADVRDARAAGGNDLSAVRAAVVAEILKSANEAEAAFADVKSHVSGVAVSVKNHIGTTSAQASDGLLHELKAHAEGIATALHEKSDSVGADIHKYVDMSVADAKEFMNSEIWKRYETLVKDAAGAARIVDASKISMAVCDVCHLATRRFAVSRINGNIICAGCAATGQK
jgi:hypothetical protein